MTEWQRVSIPGNSLLFSAKYLAICMGYAIYY